MAIPLETALMSLYESIVVGFPAMVYAVIVLIIGYIIGRIVGAVVEKALIRMNVDKYVVEHKHMAMNISAVIALVVKWWIYFVTIQAFANILEIPAIISIVQSVIDFIPGIIGAIVVLVVSYAIAIYAKENVLGSRDLYSNIVGKIIFFLIIYIGIATALPLLGVDPFLINSILLLIVGALSVGLAIAMGFGLKDVIAESARDYAKAKPRRK